MRLLRAILYQVIDWIFIAVTLFIFIMFLLGKWTDMDWWFGACILYSLGNIYNKARIAIWMDDWKNSLKD